MSFEKIIPGMQANQQAMLESVLKPRGKIAESPKNRKPGERLNEFYAMNPNMRSGEFDPSGAKAQGRANFQTWQSDQMQKLRGYDEISQRRRAMNPTAGVAPTGGGMSVAGQPPASASPGPMGPPRSASNLPQETGPRINRLTGLPFGYRPGDDLSGFDANVQQEGVASVGRMNETTRGEVARRNQVNQNYNQFLEQSQPKPQYREGPDGQLYPVATPVQGADARITPEQFNAAGGDNMSPGNAGLRMEYRRQNDPRYGASMAGDVTKATPTGAAPRAMIDPNQFMGVDPVNESKNLAEMVATISGAQNNVQPPKDLPSAANFFGLPLMGNSPIGEVDQIGDPVEMPGQEFPQGGIFDLANLLGLGNMSPVGSMPEPQPGGIAQGSPQGAQFQVDPTSPIPPHLQKIAWEAERRKNSSPVTRDPQHSPLRNVVIDFFQGR
jgi:hypothetical protein